MTYEDIANQLAPLESFDPSVFQGDAVISQKLCDFVLALTIAYNDLRDSTFALILLDDVVVNNDKIPTPQLGLRNGLKETVLRIHIGFINELLALVAANKVILDHQAFRSLVNKLSVKGKKSWASIQSAACDKKSNDPLVKALIIIRNKVAFHYDATQIGKAYKLAFLTKSEYDKPLLSRGSSMRETRFYFADAASQKYIRDNATQKIILDFLEGRETLREDINLALFELITKFINSRSTWQKYKVGT